MSRPAKEKPTPRHCRARLRCVTLFRDRCGSAIGLQESLATGRQPKRNKRSERTRRSWSPPSHASAAVAANDVGQTRLQYPGASFAGIRVGARPQRSTARPCPAASRRQSRSRHRRNPRSRHARLDDVTDGSARGARQSAGLGDRAARTRRRRPRYADGCSRLHQPVERRASRYVRAIVRWPPPP